MAVCYRGRDAACYHRRRLASSEAATPCLVEHGQSVQLAVTMTYKHVGRMVDGDSLLPEAKTRGALALHAVKPLSESCLANSSIPLRRHHQILASLGISVLCHNVGTWRRLNEQEYHAWTAALWKLYNCMYRNELSSDFHRRTIEHAALTAGAFAPDALLHVCRLRLLINLLKAPGDVCLRSASPGCLLIEPRSLMIWPGLWMRSMLSSYVTSGILASGRRSPECQFKYISQAHTPSRIVLEPSVAPARVDLQGYGAIGFEPQVFLELWRNHADGPWTTCEDDWRVFAAALDQEYQNCSSAAITWHQDDYEEVNRVLDLFYGIAKHYGVQEKPAPPPETPFERFKRLEARYGSLPTWMGLKAEPCLRMVLTT